MLLLEIYLSQCLHYEWLFVISNFSAWFNTHTIIKIVCKYNAIEYFIMYIVYCRWGYCYHSCWRNRVHQELIDYFTLLDVMTHLILLSCISHIPKLSPLSLWGPTGHVPASHTLGQEWDTWSVSAANPDSLCWFTPVARPSPKTSIPFLKPTQRAGKAIMAASKYIHSQPFSTPIHCTLPQCLHTSVPYT